MQQVHTHPIVLSARLFGHENLTESTPYGDATRKEELRVTLTFAPEGDHKVQMAIELVHTVIFPVGDPHVAIEVDGHIPKLDMGYSRPLTCGPLKNRTLQRDFLKSATTAVHYAEIVLSVIRPSLSGVDDSDSLRGVKRTTDLPQVLATTVEYLNSMIVCIGYIEVALRVQGDTRGRSKMPGTISGMAHGLDPDKLLSSIQQMDHSVIAGIRHEHIPIFVGGDASRISELTPSLPLFSIYPQAVHRGVVDDIMLAGVHPVNGKLIVIELSGGILPLSQTNGS
jgi:hypothetical protein